MSRTAPWWTRVTAAALGLFGAATIATNATAQAPPSCPSPGQGYEIAGCFVDGSGNEYPTGGTVVVHDLAFGQALAGAFPAGIFVADAFQVVPPSSPPASCGGCGPVDFCAVVTFNATAAGTPLPQAFCAPGVPTVNDGGFDLRSLNGGAPIEVTVPTFTIGGTVSGLAGTGLVLRNNNADDLPVAGNGGFEFSTPISNGLMYAVTVAAQPTGPSQECTVTNAAGTVDGGDVSDVEVTCVTRTADLAVTKTDGLDSAPAGEPLTYVITVRNGGPEDVLGARVLDLLPAELGGATWTCTPGPGAACPASGADDIDVLVDIAADDALVFVLTAVTSTDIEDTVVNEVDVIEPDDIVDPNLANNTASDTTSLNGVFQDGFEDPILP
jgi:uncharacterized repeat protein (TIGR01451 family)